jgi:hypothetical protein
MPIHLVRRVQTVANAAAIVFGLCLLTAAAAVLVGGAF